jgi:hypothetical protein
MKMQGNWNCQVCKGFGVLDRGGSRQESPPCPVCFPTRPDPDPDLDPAGGYGFGGPFSVCHVHGHPDDPICADVEGNTNDPEEAQVIALERAEVYRNGSLVVYDARGERFLTIECPLVRRPKPTPDEPAIRNAA